MKKIIMFLMLFIVMLLAVSNVNAANNSSDMMSDIDEMMSINSVYDVDNEEIINKSDIYDIKNIRNDNLNYDRLGYSVKNDEILESQYPGYTVKVKNVTKFYDQEKNIDITVSRDSNYRGLPCFYLKIYDSKNIEKVSELYSNGNLSYVYKVKDRSLDPGIYSIKIVDYANNYLMTSATLTIQSIPRNAYSVSISNKNFIYKTKTSIDISVSPTTKYYYAYDFYLKIYDSKNVEKFSERYFSTSSSKRVVSDFKSGFWEPGTYTMKIINNVDNYVMDTAKLNIFAISYSNYSVSVSNIEMDYGVGGKITMAVYPAESEYLKYDFYLKIFDSDNVEKISGRYYGNKDYTHAVYNIGGTVLDPGIYNIKIINTLDNHLMATSNLTVKSVPYSAYSVSVSNTNLNYGIGGTIDISISPASSGYLKYDFYLKIYDSNNVEKVSKRYYNTTSSKKVTYTIGATGLNQGNYTIKIINNDDGYVMKIATLTIDKTTIESADLTGDCDKIIQYKVRVAKNNEFKNGLKVTFSCNGKEYTNITDSNGYAYLNIHFAVGNYSITTKCNGALKINKLFIKTVYVDNAYNGMHIDSLTTYYGTDKTINYGWNGFFKGSLKIYKESILIKTIVLDNSKYFNDYYTYDIYSNSISTSELKDAGTYSLKIMNQNEKIITQSSVIIKKAPTELHVNDVYAFKNSKETTYLFLYENKKEDPDVNGVVTVKFNGNTYNVNMKSGVGKVSFKVPSKYKQYWGTATFKGDSNHESSSCKFWVDVIKYDCDVIVSDISKVKPGAKITLKANVYYKMGTKKLTSGEINFKVNGKTYKAKIKNGVAKVTINAPKKAKTYTCKASYAGTKDIYSSSTKFKITVKSAKKKKTTSFTVVVPTKLNQKISKSYGIYKVTTRKFISNLYYGGKNAKLQILVYKNGKPLTDFKAKYVVCISSGKQVSVTVDGNWWSRSISYNDVLNAYKIKATVWP